MAEKTDKKTKVCHKASSDRFAIRHLHTKEVEASGGEPCLFMRTAVKLSRIVHWRGRLQAADQGQNFTWLFYCYHYSESVTNKESVYSDRCPGGR